MDAGPFSLSAYIGDKFNKPKKRIMTIEEYKAQVFKYDGKGLVTIGDEWPYLPRATRSEIDVSSRKERTRTF